MKTRVGTAAVIGAGTCGPETASVAEDLGRLLGKSGVDIVCGGLGGVMESVCRGASRTGVRTIGILPGIDRTSSNRHVSFPVATGLGHMRNYLVVINSDVVIAVEGETGTLSEIALALKSGKKVIAIGRWRNIPGVIPADTPESAVKKALRIIEGE